MDGLDRKVIDLFAAEPRIGVLEASRRLGVARGTVQARLDKLASTGVITGWGPDVSPAALGYPVTAFLTLEIRAGRAATSRRRPPGRDPRGARGVHDHRRRRHVGPRRRPLQRRPPARHRPGPPPPRHRPLHHRHRPGDPDPLPGPAARSSDVAGEIAGGTSGLSRSGRRSPLAQPVDPGAELLGAGDGGGRAAALLAQLGVGDAVGLAGAVVPGGDETVELAAQDGQLLVRGSSATVTGSSAVDRPTRSLWRWCSSCTYLVGLEQPGDAEEVHLLLGPDVHLAGVAERRPVEEHLVEPGLRAERLERAEQVVGGRLPRLAPGRAVAPRRPSGRPRSRCVGRARGRAPARARRRSPAGWAPTAGTPTRSRPGPGPARTGRRPGRRTAASRWWSRTRPRPAAARRRPRTPSAPRPSSGPRSR